MAVTARVWRGLLLFAVSRKVDTTTPIQAEAEPILWTVNLACQVLQNKVNTLM